MADTETRGAAPTREREILEILGAELGVPVTGVQEDLIDSGLLDSLAFVDLLFRIESRYGTRIDVATLDLDDLRTVARIAALVDRTAAAG